MTTIKTPAKKTMKIGDIKPYEGNPRRIPPEAVASVKSSMEKYGYQQPIVVDPEGVIIVGHTRYLAMVEMGITSVQVYVADLPEDKAREYRLVDNRTGEMSQWDHQALVMELREFDESLLEEFFPDIDLEVSTLKDALVTEDDMDKAAAKVTKVNEAPQFAETEVVCPSCFNSFKVRTNSLPGLSGEDLKQLTE